MNSSEFLWHAKRGHGECVALLKSRDIVQYKNIVKKVFLNNYAFLMKDEYRSSYACELVNFYKDDLFFVKLLWNKIIKTNLKDNYTFEYLVNNLYFILKRNKSYNFESKLRKLLIKSLSKELYSFEESDSICALLSLIFDLKMNINVKNIIDRHYVMFNNSNLNVSLIEYNYQITFSKRSVQKNNIKEDCFENYGSLLKYISNSETFCKELPFISTHIHSNYISKLFESLDDKDIDDLTKTNILKVIYYSQSFKSGNLSQLVSFIEKSNDEQKMIIYEIISNMKSTKTMSVLNKNGIDDCLYIRIALKNYKESYYHEIHKRIRKLKIDYNNSHMWFEVESDLIHYFRRKKIDKRFIDDLKFFLKNGLSSNSRYRIVKILEKYGALSDEEKYDLKYDANYKIRKMLNKKI